MKKIFVEMVNILIILNAKNKWIYIKLFILNVNDLRLQLHIYLGISAIKLNICSSFEHWFKSASIIQDIQEGHEGEGIQVNGGLNEKI